MSDQGFDGGRNLRDRNDRREPMTYITTHDGDKGDDSGVAAIVKAFVRNPAGAFQIIAFIGGMYGLYYAMQSEINDVRAAQVSNFEKLNSKVEQIVLQDTAESLKIETLYQRGDTRYNNIIAKLASHDVDIAKIIASLDFVVDQFKQGSNVERPVAPPHIRPSDVPTIP